MSRQKTTMRIVLCAILMAGRMDAQLFPFTNLKRLLEQKSEDRPTELPALTTIRTKLEDEYAHTKDYPLETTGQGFPSPPAAFDQSTKSPDDEERTVIVTPKPKYTPQKLVPEPKLDPNSDLVPSMGYKPISQQQQPVRSLTINPPPDPPEHTPEQDVRISTIVETVPSLSVTIPDESTYRKKLPEGIVDYLVPPKFPSVYETIGLLPSSGSNAIGNDNYSTDNQKSQKKKKNRNKAANYSPYKDDNDDAEKAGSDKRKVKTVRPRRPARPIIHVPSLPNVQVTPSLPPLKKLNRSPTTVKPFKGTTQKDNDDSNNSESSPSDFYVKPRRPQQETQNHFESPFDDQEVAQSSFGLGGSTGERVEFQMHGHSGPESYKFGFDTGDGKNRHFRYEEKDGHGNVKGHYGYYDKSGKLKVVNYHADKYGFHANAA